MIERRYYFDNQVEVAVDGEYYVCDVTGYLTKDDFDNSVTYSNVTNVDAYDENDNAIDKDSDLFIDITREVLNMDFECEYEPEGLSGLYNEGWD